MRGRAPSYDAHRGENLAAVEAALFSLDGIGMVATGVEIISRDAAVSAVASLDLDAHLARFGSLSDALFGSTDHAPETCRASSIGLRLIAVMPLFFDTRSPCPAAFGTSTEDGFGRVLPGVWRPTESRR
jgi:hypothetical protein